MKVLALTNPAFVGDNNQVLGITAAMRARDASTSVINEADLNIDELSPDTLIVAAGDHGLRIIDAIKNKRPEILALWSGHQFFDDFQSITHWPNTLALPKTAVSEEHKLFIAQHKTRLELTDGVAHNVHLGTIRDDMNRFKGTFPLTERYPVQIGIVLAGDAPTASGEMRFFGPDDARKQAQFIAQHIKRQNVWSEKTAIMITNGPRTGKHNAETGEIYSPDPHRSGEVDASSSAFIEALSHELQAKPEQISFYDFQFANLPSAYKPLMFDIMINERSMWFVPCESTSMVSESTWLVERCVDVVVYHPASENDAHLRHAEDYVGRGIVTDINNPDAVHAKRDTRFVAAATQIAASVLSPLVPLVPHCSFFASSSSSQVPDTWTAPQPS